MEQEVCYGEMQHGHMEQVGYDTYCKLLDEVMLEMQGIEVPVREDVQIDLSLSSYIPDSFIENSSQKIEIYQNIATSQTEEDIQNVIDEVIDRYGKLPKELDNLLEIARIKQLAKKAKVSKIVQKGMAVLFYMSKEEAITPQMVNHIMKTYPMQVRFSSGIEPYITLRLKEETSEKELIKQVKEFLNHIQKR